MVAGDGRRHSGNNTWKEIVLPIPVAKGDDSRMRPATTPMNTDHTNERGNETEEEEEAFISM